jgi:hypothetical protein
LKFEIAKNIQTISPYSRYKKEKIKKCKGARVCEDFPKIKSNFPTYVLFHFEHSQIEHTAVLDFLSLPQSSHLK